MDNGIRNYLQPLIDQKVFVIVFCVSAMLAALAQTYIFSEKYQTVTTVIYKPQEITRLRAQETRSFGAPLPTVPFKIINENLQEIIMSEALLRPVVIELGLDQEKEKVYEGPWYEQLYQQAKDLAKQYAGDLWSILKYGRLTSDAPDIAAIKDLRKNLELVNDNSYVFNLIVKDKDPALAARIADTLARDLVAWLQNEQNNPGTVKLLQIGELLETKNAEIVRYQNEIRDLLIKHNMASVTIETERAMERLSDIKLKREDLESEIAQTRAKLVAVTRHKDKKSLNGDNRDDIKKRTVPIAPEDYKKLTSEELFTEIELSALEPKYETLQSSVAQLEAELSILPNIQRTLDQLQVQLDRAKSDYEQLSDVYQEAKVQSTGEFSELKLLHKAHIPRIPVAPVKIYHVGLAGLLSLSISIGLVYLLTYAKIQFLFSPRTRLPMILIQDRRQSTDRRQTEDRRTEDGLLGFDKAGDSRSDVSQERRKADERRKTIGLRKDDVVKHFESGRRMPRNRHD